MAASASSGVINDSDPISLSVKRAEHSRKSLLLYDKPHDAWIAENGGHETVIPLAKRAASKREAPTGRTVNPAGLAEVPALVGTLPLRGDLLIACLHLINHCFKQLSAAHLAALARLLKLTQTEVDEVATFYHHFDIVKEDQDGGVAALATRVVRVCDGLRCEMAGVKALLARLSDLLSREVRVLAAPCAGRCQQPPVAVAHQKPIGRVTLDVVRKAVDSGQRRDQPGAGITLQSQRGKVSLCAHADESSPYGSVLVAVCCDEAATNKRTNSARDPFGKIPEFKYYAVRISLGGTPPVQVRSGGGQILAAEPAGVEQ